MTWACGIALVAWRLEWSGVTVQSLCLETQSIGWILVSEGEGAWEALAWCQGMAQEDGRAWGGRLAGLGDVTSRIPAGSGMWSLANVFTT